MELENRVGQEMSPQQNLHHVSATTCIASFPMMPQQAMQPALMMQPQPVCPNLAHGQVMTDEQLETLRRQISVYATICQQLVEMHKAMMAHQNSASGLWLSPSLSFDSSLHKLTSRQRWTPSQTQLHILERLFEQESGTPNKQRIKEITIELSQHGQISETNVYNWFQNRRARTKRKQQLGGPNNAESELDTDVEMPEEKKGKTKGGLFNGSFNNAHFGEGYTRGSNMEHHQGISEMSPVQESVDCYTALVNQAAFNGHAFDDKQTLSSNDLEASLLAEHKLWDLPWGVSESKVDFGGLSTSEEFHGRRMIISGVESHH